MKITPFAYSGAPEIGFADHHRNLSEKVAFICQELVFFAVFAGMFICLKSLI